MKREQPLDGHSMPSRSAGLKRDISGSGMHRGTPRSDSRDKFTKGSAGLSIKFKKSANDDVMCRGEYQVKDRFRHGLGKTMRETPPLEIGPKRLKLRYLPHSGKIRSDEVKFRSV